MMYFSTMVNKFLISIKFFSIFFTLEFFLKNIHKYLEVKSY